MLALVCVFLLVVTFTAEHRVDTVANRQTPALTTRSVCRSLQASAAHPLRAWKGSVVRRRADGAIEVVAESPDGVEAPRSEEPVGTAPSQEVE